MTFKVIPDPAVGYHYFPPGLPSPSQPKNVTVLPPVSKWIYIRATRPYTLNCDGGAMVVFIFSCSLQKWAELQLIQNGSCDNLRSNFRLRIWFVPRHWVHSAETSHWLHALKLKDAVTVVYPTGNESVNHSLHCIFRKWSATIFFCRRWEKLLLESRLVCGR